MAAKLRNLVHLVDEKDMQLVAGEKGLNHTVNWVHVVEEAELASFLEGGEIVFITGVALSESNNLLKIVQSVYDAGASAIVVNVGSFINAIDEETISFCEESSFPLFRVPWRVYMAKIMRVFCNAIFISEKNNLELTEAVRKAILCPEQEEMYLGYLKENGLGIEWNYCVEINQFYNQITQKRFFEKKLMKIKRVFENIIAQQEWNVVCLIMDHEVVLVFSNYTRRKIEEMMTIFQKYVAMYLKPGEVCYSSAGKITKSARCIGKSYRMAQKLNKVVRKNERTNEVVYYDDMGIYKLLLAIEDKEILNEFWTESIKNLIEYDEMNKTNYTEILKRYLDNNGSVAETAKAVYVHRNTINYKLNKIEDILQVDLFELKVRERLSLGLMVNDMIK